MEDFWDEGNALVLRLGAGYMGVLLCENPTSHTLLLWPISACMLDFNKRTPYRTMEGIEAVI